MELKSEQGVKRASCVVSHKRIEPRNNYKGISEAVENLGFGLGSGFVGSYNSN